MQTGDEQLLRLIGRGGAPARDALAELAGRYEHLLLGLAVHLLRGREDLARDVVQEAWLRILRFAGGFDARSSARTWMYRIVINRCHDVRATWARHEQARRDDQDVSAPRVDDASFTTHPHLDRLREAIDALPDGQGMVVLLFYHGDMTLPQVADILGIAEGTAKSRLHAALEALREKLVLPEVTR